MEQYLLITVCPGLILIFYLKSTDRAGKMSFIVCHEKKTSLLVVYPWYFIECGSYAFFTCWHSHVFFSVQNHRYACLLIHLNCCRRWDFLMNAESFIICLISGASILFAFLDFMGMPLSCSLLLPQLYINHVPLKDALSCPSSSILVFLCINCICNITKFPTLACVLNLFFFVSWCCCWTWWHNLQWVSM